MKSEHQEQVELFKWSQAMQVIHPQLSNIFAIPNGGARDRVTGAMLKREGVKSGVPDIMLAHPNGTYHGLFIELKRCGGGKLSKAQKQWIKNLNEVGYKAVVCHGANEAIKIIEEYLE